MTAIPHPYPACQPSDVEWLGDVPTHWQVVPLSSVSRPKSIINQQHRELLSVYLNIGVVKFSDVNERRTNPTSDDLSRYQAVDHGDLVLNNQQAWRGSVGVSNLDGIVSPAYLVLSLSSTLNPRFANILFRDDSMVGQYVVCSKGVGTIQRNLYWPHLKRVLTLVPPLLEQAAIVRYVGHVDQRIRRYVAAKRKLIALLEEEKQAVINQAVTRGLDPKVRLKDSGVPWLGGVPEHWEVPRLKDVGYLKSGAGFPHSHQGNLSAEFPFFKVGDMAVSGNERRMQAWKHTVSSDTANILGAHVFLPNTIVFAKVGAALLLNRRRVLTRPSCIDNNMMGFLPRGHSTEWMCHWLSTVDFRMVVNPGAVPSVNEGQLEVLPVLVPPLSEQAAIVEYLEKATTDFNAAIARARRQIELLQEYRTRLIADVVTGKLDVREAAAQLPDEADDQDQMEESGPLIDGIGEDLYDAEGSAEELAIESEVTA